MPGVIKFRMRGRNENIPELSRSKAKEIFGGAPRKPNALRPRSPRRRENECGPELTCIRWHINLFALPAANLVRSRVIDDAAVAFYAHEKKQNKKNQQRQKNKTKRMVADS